MWVGVLGSTSLIFEAVDEPEDGERDPFIYVRFGVRDVTHGATRVTGDDSGRFDPECISGLVWLRRCPAEIGFARVFVQGSASISPRCGQRYKPWSGRSLRVARTARCNGPITFPSFKEKLDETPSGMIIVESLCPSDNQ